MKWSETAVLRLDILISNHEDDNENDDDDDQDDEGGRGSPHLWHGHSWDVPQMSEIRSIPDIYGILILHDFEAS